MHQYNYHPLRTEGNRSPRQPFSTGPRTVSPVEVNSTYEIDEEGHVLDINNFSGSVVVTPL